MSSQKNPLPLPDQRYLDAAEGWLGLGDHSAANEELDQIRPELGGHPLVLTVRYRIYAMAGKWDNALEIAKRIRNLLPEISWGHFHLAQANYYLKRYKEAYDVLRPVVDQFPNDWTMRYDLACYCCRLENLTEAMMWLEKTIDLAGEKDVRQTAFKDPDLEPLWARIGEM